MKRCQNILIFDIIEYTYGSVARHNVIEYTYGSVARHISVHDDHLGYITLSFKSDHEDKGENVSYLKALIIADRLLVSPTTHSYYIQSNMYTLMVYVRYKKMANLFSPRYHPLYIAYVYFHRQSQYSLYHKKGSKYNLQVQVFVEESLPVEYSQGNLVQYMFLYKEKKWLQYICTSFQRMLPVYIIIKMVVMKKWKECSQKVVMIQNLKWCQKYAYLPACILFPSLVSLIKLHASLCLRSNVLNEYKRMKRLALQILRSH